MTSEQELWAVALWVEKNHGADGLHFIADRVGRLEASGDADGSAMWRKVAQRFIQLDEPRSES